MEPNTSHMPEGDNQFNEKDLPAGSSRELWLECKQLPIKFGISLTDQELNYVVGEAMDRTEKLLGENLCNFTGWQKTMFSREVVKVLESILEEGCTTALSNCPEDLRLDIMIRVQHELLLIDKTAATDGPTGDFLDPHQWQIPPTTEDLDLHTGLVYLICASQTMMEQEKIFFDAGIDITKGW